MNVALVEQQSKQMSVEQNALLDMNNIANRTVTVTHIPTGMPEKARVAKLEANAPGTQFQVISGEFDVSELSLRDLIAKTGESPEEGRLMIFGKGDTAKALKSVVAMAAVCPEHDVEDLMALAQKDPSVAQYSKNEITKRLLSGTAPAVDAPTAENRPALRPR